MELKGMSLDLISAGTLAMDGGLMFGVVPRVMWENFKTPDEKNRVRMGLNVMLIRTGSANILVDTGCGEALSPRLAEIHTLRGRYMLRETLQEKGLEFENIDMVILSHLHFDHAGGMTLEREGKVVPAFPNARYFVQKREYEEWLYPNERTRGGYRSVHCDVLTQDGRLELLEGESEVAPGVKVLPTPGHTEGHQCVLVDPGEEKAVCFLGDVVPTRYNVPLAWATANDVLPLVQLETKRSILKRAVEENWTVIFPHEIGPRFFSSEILQQPGSTAR